MKKGTVHIAIKLESGNQKHASEGGITVYCPYCKARMEFSLKGLHVIPVIDISADDSEMKVVSLKQVEEKL